MKKEKSIRGYGNMNNEKPLGYLGGDIMSFGSNLARQWEYDKFKEMDLDVNDIIVYDPISVQKAEVPKLSQTLGDNYNKGNDANPVKLGSNEYTSTPIRDQRISNAVNATRYSSTNSYYERTLQKVVDTGEIIIVPLGIYSPK